MSHIVSGEGIAQSIAGCAPRQIAVAFLGADWKTYISRPDQLTAVILSPTLGTNPRAVTALARAISWERIFFLKELHAKIYIGEARGVLGSANLTANGLSGEHLLECCVEITDQAELSDLELLFKAFKSSAENQFPTTALKKQQLSALYDLWNAALANRLVSPTNETSPSINEFELASNEHFYVLWYMPPPPYDYSDEVKQIQSRIVEEIHLSPEDAPQKNKFALLWKKTAKGNVDRWVSPYWMYIHEVIRDAIVAKGYEYTTCVIQRNDLAVPPEPFELTPAIVDRLRGAIESPELSQYLVQDGCPFRLQATFNGLPPLVEALRKGG